ncbi:ABC transporter substrate-binding protein [Rubrobacter marinus]|uniref:ABC transporter substrate-binding protein n=1 Tax=Rubrobacter marinus TaxID=2653852 RepID=UPI0014081F6A|nr:ABC transporter substrate-binding protein [Rubrobacter marinus]
MSRRKESKLPSLLRKLKKFLLVPFVLALAFVLVGCGGQSGQAQSADGTTTVRVGTIPIDAEAQVFYAKDRGFFEDVGLNVEVQSITNGAAIVSAVQSGSLDIGCSNVVSVATAIERGLPLNLVAPGAVYSSEAPSTALMVAKDSPIQSAADLNGKVVAVNGLKNITEVGARAWIDENGGDASSVRFIELPFPQMGAALAEGRADAAVVAEPALTQASGDARVLGDAYSAVADEFLITAYFSTSDWAEQNPEVADKFAQAIQEAGKWANDNPEESAKILEKYTEISAETANGMTRAVNAETFDPALVQPPLDSAGRFDVLKSPPDASELVPE